MSWDKNVPTDDYLVKDTDDDFRDMKAIMKSVISVEHDFDTGEHLPGKVRCVQIGDESSLSLSDNQMGYSTDQLTVRVHYDGNDYSPEGLTGEGSIFPAGTKMFFFQDVAPPGWAIYSSSEVDGDVVVMIDSENAGSLVGSWTGMNASGSHYHTLSFAEHVHSMRAAGVTSHRFYIDNSYRDTETHTFGYYLGTPDGSSVSGGTVVDTYGVYEQPSGTTDETTISSSSDGSWRPPGLYFIVAEKD